MARTRDERSWERGLLGLLQLADSGFPSGAFTLSSGLETLAADRVVITAPDVAEVLDVALSSRLARADLPALLGAYAAWTDTELVAAIDRRLSACKLPREEREGSARVGRRIATEVSVLTGSDALGAFVAAIEAGRSPGNAAVAFGLAARALGATRRDAALAAGSSFAVGFATAAVRLALMGHRDAQGIIHGAAGTIEAAVDTAETMDPLQIRPSTPQLDVAIARHEVAVARAFAS